MPSMVTITPHAMRDTSDSQFCIILSIAMRRSGGGSSCLKRDFYAPILVTVIAIKDNNVLDRYRTSNIHCHVSIIITFNGNFVARFFCRPIPSRHIPPNFTPIRHIPYMTVTYCIKGTRLCSYACYCKCPCSLLHAARIVYKSPTKYMKRIMRLGNFQPAGSAIYSLKCNNPNRACFSVKSV